MNEYELILKKNRKEISGWPKENDVVLIISGGLDSVIMAAKLLEKGYTVYPLHIERGQTNYLAERKSIIWFTKFYQKKYPEKFKDTLFIKLNIPPKEFKKSLIPYTQKNGHPLRDTMLQMAAVQYATSLQARNINVNSIFCAVMPEDHFPHSNLKSIRATNVAVCQNTNNWNWLITSPNIDPYLESNPIDKPASIKWASEHDIPIEYTVSCNESSKLTNLRNCGTCSSCLKRQSAFKTAKVKDKTKYYTD
jgi:7-cyano-7-deazaguanine synthase in queuosine biosynthesis